MATFSAVQRRHLLQAIEEYDARGRDHFLGLYGFVPTAGYALVHEGRSYDVTAILGVAHRYATGRLATVEEFHEGAQGAAAILRRRGFEVSEPARSVPLGARVASSSPARRASSTRTRPAPSPSATPRRLPLADRPVTLCPTCFMALPGTGVCDSCY